MKIAILGATSEIAKDLILSFAKDKQLHLFARRPDEVNKWLDNLSIQKYCLVDDFSKFGKQEFDAIINFVGVGNPAKAAAIGASIFDITLKYDEMALNYLFKKPNCRYIFLSSGAAYGASFDSPGNVLKKAIIDINNLKPQDWYSIAKLHTEARHRSLSNQSIVDIRVFNYFSHRQDMNSRFFIADIVRAIRDNTKLKVNSDNIFRDFIGPHDFSNLVESILYASATNDVIDAYTLMPINKMDLLELMKKHFGLSYEISKEKVFMNATGIKPHYYSVNKRAEIFGYTPSMSSSETIVKEVKKILSNKNKG